MTKILVYRFSAMGDVILLLPVLRGVLDANDDIELFLITRNSFFPVFQNLPRLHLIEADLKGSHAGFVGMFRLFRKIKKEIRPAVVVDLHCVIRTYFLDMLFRLSGFRVILFQKGTFRKRRLIKSKVIEQLPTTIDRYSSAFLKLGLKISLPEIPVLETDVAFPEVDKIVGKSLLIGIAPFAKHEQKVWGISKIENLIREIAKKYDARIILFGGGDSELEVLKQLSGKFPDCIVAANHFNLTEEIQLIRRLSVMVSMDSANMHLASMAGVPTISIWGATHPALGFAPYNQPKENLIQYEGDQISCRPCSVYGNKKCIFPDGIRCMELISVERVFERINQILS